jgi:hypothetical protein
MGGVLCQQILALEPAGVRMREVVRPEQSLVVQHVQALQRHPVPLERQVDVFHEVLARLALDAVIAPVRTVEIVVVGILHVVRRPAGIGLRADQQEIGMALEHATPDE